MNLPEVPEAGAYVAVFLADGRVVEAGASRELFGRPRDSRIAKFAQGVPAF
ncbi:hypothetical protein [Burkholderia sp. AW49-1]